jgi:sporulation integral membrane protein YtvI
MDLKKYTRVLIYISLGIALAWLGFRYLLPILLPFLIGFLLSRLAEPILRALQKNKRLPRWVCSAASMLVLYAVLGTAIFFLCRALLTELQAFVTGLPEVLASLAGPMQGLREKLDLLAARLPDGLGDSLTQWIDNLFRSGSVVAESVYNWLFDLAAGTVSSLPSIVLFVVTVILSSFMLSSEWPGLRRALAKRLPEPWRQKLSSFLSRLKSAMGGWLKAQLKLLGICFGVLTIGLWILGVDYPLLFGAIIALVDALPVLGSGTILVPWAIVEFLQGQTPLGCGLMILYGVSSLTRTAVEPRVLGRQIGLSPVITLFSMYAGWRLMRVAGMILFPICAILIRQFTELWEAQKN